MRQLFRVASLGIVAVGWLVVSVQAQVSPPGSTGSSRPPAAGFASDAFRTNRTVDSLQRLTQPGYYSTLLVAKPQPKGSLNARLAVDKCNFYLCTATSPVLSVSLANNGPLTCSQPRVDLTVTGAPASSTYAFGANATQPGGPTSPTATVATAGTYSVTVTAPDGARATAQTTVTAEQTTPPVSLTNDGPLSTARKSGTLRASSTVTGTYAFSGPGVMSSQNNTATVNQPGTYTVVLTTAGGCSASATTTVGLTGARLAAEESETPFEVTVLGNPVVGDAVEVAVRGVQGQPLRVRVVDSQGREVSSQQRASAEAVERLRLGIGTQPAGLLLLQVSTPTQFQTVKVLKQ